MPTNSFPDWIQPMAATLTQERFTGPEWLFERKLDGIRLLAFKNGTDVRLLQRSSPVSRFPGTRAPSPGSTPVQTNARVGLADPGVAKFQGAYST